MPDYTRRTVLRDVLPLSAPFSLHVYPSFYCNFRCGYCLHSLSEDALKRMGFERRRMGFGVFRKAVDDAAALGWRMKALIFAGHGEPLLHPQIADMVAYAKAKGIAERTEIVTNGSLLTHSLSDALIAAGLDRLRVSVQGTSAEAYQDVCGASLDYDAFVERLRYFYEHKKHTDVYIKIIDVALRGAGDEARFRAIFSPIADTVAVERAIPFVPGIDIKGLSGQSKQGGRTASAICSMPFYMLTLYPNGDAFPCCATRQPISLGNVNERSLGEIWASRERTDFLLRQLDGASSAPVCRECAVPSYGLQEGDPLDERREELKRIYARLRGERGGNSA